MSGVPVQRLPGWEASVRMVRAGYGAHFRSERHEVVRVLVPRACVPAGMVEATMLPCAVALPHVIALRSQRPASAMLHMQTHATSNRPVTFPSAIGFLFQAVLHM